VFAIISTAPQSSGSGDVSIVSAIVWRLHPIND